MRISSGALRDGALAVIVLGVLFGVDARFAGFASPGGLADLANDTSLLVILALGQALVLITRAVDLSVAANVAASGMIAALLNVALPELGVAGALGAALFTGTLLGVVNGVLVWRLDVPPIVATLGTMAIFRGLAFFASGGNWVNSNAMSADFIGFQRLQFLGLTTPSWMALGAIGAVTLLLRFTRLGRGFYVAGGNADAALYVGVTPARSQFFSFAISGLLAGLVGYFWVSRFGIAYADTATGFELQVIAACVIGGVAINGGAGTVAGVVLGALFLGIVKNALPLLNVSPFWQMAVSGLVIIAAVTANGLLARKSRRMILERHA